MTQRYTLLTLTVAALFLMIVGVLTRGQQLFYMSTVLIVTLLMMRFQAELAVRGLRFARSAPKVIVAGELVSIKIRVWSLWKIRRPLLLISDVIPPRMARSLDVRPVPVAPSFEEAVETRYDFRATKRGCYRWSKIMVRSTDSMGIVHVNRTYEADPIEIVVHPSRIPLGVDLATLSGWGANQADEGKNRGSGMSTQGVREFAAGDSLRHVHWRSTAKTGTLQVKEFETGFNTNLMILPQLTSGTAFGEDDQSTLEAMCGHAAYISDIMLGRGSAVEFPNLETDRQPAHSADARYKQICDALARAECDHQHLFADEIATASKTASAFNTFVLMITVAEPGLAEAIVTLSHRSSVLVLVYDVRSFVGPNEKLPYLAATDADFISAISRKGVRVKIVTNPFITDEKAA